MRHSENASDRSFLRGQGQITRFRVKKAAVEIGGLSKRVSVNLSVFQHAFFARELCHAFLQLFERPHLDLANAFTADIVLT